VEPEAKNMQKYTNFFSLYSIFGIGAEAAENQPEACTKMATGQNFSQLIRLAEIYHSKISINFIFK
jgi:hypothetical protein